MSDTTTELVPAGAAGALAVSDGPAELHKQNADHSHHAEHSTPRQYVLIAIVLSVITAVEIAASYLPDEVPNWVKISLLCALAAIKFFMVVAWFMHLRFDSKILRRFFILGLVAAPILYMIVLTSLHVFDATK